MYHRSRIMVLNVRLNSADLHSNKSNLPCLFLLWCGELGSDTVVLKWAKRKRRRKYVA